MGQFRLVVSYDNPVHFEHIEVQAEDISVATSMCQRIISDYNAMVELMDLWNIFASRRMCSCEVDQNTKSNSFITTVT